jgi:hypothetical protein
LAASIPARIKDKVHLGNSAKGANFGGLVIDQATAFSVFRKWRDASPPTRLRADAELGKVQFSFACSVRRAEEPLLALTLEGCGFIELVFDGTWGFDFLSFDALRLAPEKRTGKSPLGERRYEFGEQVVAARKDSGGFMFLAEVVREL